MDLIATIVKVMKEAGYTVTASQIVEVSDTLCIALPSNGLLYLVSSDPKTDLVTFREFEPRGVTDIAVVNDRAWICDLFSRDSARSLSRDLFEAVQ